ncbi:MAG: uracil-DNA glycosylase [Bacteroidales bacterium]
MEVKIEESWKQLLKEEFSKEYFHSIVDTIKEELSRGVKIYPPGSDIFKAFWLTPLNRVRVVLIGQDPYHRYGQAHGLAFSVPDGVRLPPSLKNIYRELHDDLGVAPSLSGNLERWAKQGVLLLNATLTVRAGEPASHSKIGWQHFTDSVISTLSQEKEGIVFLLWGAFAKRKSELIDSSKHHILVAAHPSPLAQGAFFGSRHFSQTNNILRSMGDKPIEW